jgi:hypothetical protein
MDGQTDHYRESATNNFFLTESCRILTSTDIPNAGRDIIVLYVFDTWISNTWIINIYSEYLSAWCNDRFVSFVPLTSLFYKIKCYFFIMPMAYRWSEKNFTFLFLRVVVYVTISVYRFARGPIMLLRWPWVDFPQIHKTYT